MLSRSLIVMFIASVLVATVAGGLVGWGLSSATLAAADSTAGPKGATGATGADGVAGAQGNAGASGATGATGARGATGATGARGATGATGPVGAPGAQGIPGVQGIAGTNGTDGTNASIATFSFTSAAGGFALAPSLIHVQSMTSVIPAGPALIGFSMSLVTGSPLPPAVTCGLYDSLTSTLLASASTVTLQSGVSATTALTQVVTLTAPTIVTLECSTGLGLDFASYSNLSIYGISFATT